MSYPNQLSPKILVVDDTRINLEILAGVLGQQKYKINRATNGQEALDEVNREKPDLILLDVMMPVMDGYDCITRLKQNPDTADIPVIFITAKSTMQDIVKGFDLGAVDYIIKPFNPSELLARVNTHLTLKYYQENLEDLVDERTQDLQKANEELKSLDRLKDKLLETVTHELRTPMASIMGYSEMMLEEELDQPMQLHCARVIFEEAERLSHLIENILDMSSLSSGKLDFNFAQINIHEVIERSIQAVQGLLKNQDITIDYRPHSLPFMGDFKRIMQVMINLLGNAIKFSPPKGVIHIKVVGAEDYLRVEVQDQGSGIPEEKLDSIFEKFNQIRREGQEISGTGLGLSISRGIILAHQGRIWAQNLDQGACFSFMLPITQAS